MERNPTAVPIKAGPAASALKSFPAIITYGRSSSGTAITTIGVERLEGAGAWHDAGG